MKKFEYQIGVGGFVFSEREKALIAKVLESNRLTYGPMSKQFEMNFARLHQTKFGLFMNSGTSALQIALTALKAEHSWSDGDEVIIPAVTFVATANIVIHNRMTPVFVDVEPDTYNIDPCKIEEKISDRTKAIIPVHLTGLPANMDPIMEIANNHNLAIIEDSCETMFAEYKGRPVGSFGDIGCFSTYVAHIIVTGVGGFAVTNNPKLAASMRSLMNHGRDNIYIGCTDDQGADEDNLKEIISKRFHFNSIGHSFRCTEIEAAIGLGQLSRYKENISKRTENAHNLTKGLAKFTDDIQLPTCPADRTHSYMMFGIAVKKATKKNLVNFLESLNIETRDLFPLINQPIYSTLYGELEDQFPTARWINQSGFYIGCHPYMENREIEFIIEAFDYFFNHHSL